MKCNELTFFEVTDEGIIIDPDVYPPKFRSHVFERVNVFDAHTPEDLIDEIECCPPLVTHFQSLGQQFLEQFDFEEDTSYPQHSTVIQLIYCALGSDPNNGWKLWIELSTRSGLSDIAAFQSLVNDWLSSEIDWSEREFFEPIWDGQTAALGYFCDFPAHTLKALGVKIVDSEHPGSSYRAAEINKTINEANRVASELSLDFRLLPAGASRERAKCDFGVAIPLRVQLGAHPSLKNGKVSK
jgi:hypothetical protein